MAKNKFWAIISSCLACVALVLGITISCLNFSSIRPEDAPIASNWIDKRDTSSNFGGGDGSFGYPYLINTPKQLAQLAYRVNNGEKFTGVYFEQTRNLYLGGNEWTPIGTSTNYFSGHYNGMGYIIYNLTISNGSSYQGLFGYIRGESAIKRSEIQNIGLVETNINATSFYIGGIIGRGQEVNISSCFNLGNITTADSTIGGIIGYTVHCKIRDCYNRGNITGKSGVGGIVGGFANGTTDEEYQNILYRCYNTGEINATSTSMCTGGGITGGTGASTTITNTFSTGEVKYGNNYKVGGIIGNLNSRNNYYGYNYYGGSCTLTQGIGGETDATSPSASGTTKLSSIGSLDQTVKNISWLLNLNSWNYDKDYEWANQSYWLAPRSDLNDGFATLSAFNTLKKNVYKITYDSQGGSTIDQDYICYGEAYGKNNIYDYNNIFNKTYLTIQNDKIVIDYTNTSGSTQWINFFTSFDWTLAPSTKYTAVVNVESKSYDNFNISFTSPNDTGGNGDPFIQTCSTNIAGTGTYVIGGMETKSTITTSECNFRSYIWIPAGQHVKTTFSISVFTGLYNYSGDFSYASVGNSPVCSTLPTPTRQGYAFEGWYTGKNGTGTNITPSSIFTSSANQTLYAKWRQLDSEVPVIHRTTYVTREDGYEIYTYATDNIGVKRVRFPTWTHNNSQDDIVWGEGIKGTYTIEGQTYNYKYSVNMSEHNNEIGWYVTHIYAYDEVGNQSDTGGNGEIYFARPWTDFAATSYAGGDGTENNPYQIATAGQLALLAKQAKTSSLEGKYFKQTASIDLENKATKNSQYVWYMWDGIGNFDFPFKGNFDGDFKVLSNIEMKNVGQAGFFNYAYGANISNIIMRNGKFYSFRTSDDKGNVAAIVAFGGREIENSSEIKDECTIQNCIVENVSLTCNAYGQSAGGIAGEYGNVKNCIFKNGSITGYCSLGIIGWRGSVENCSVFNATLTSTGGPIYIIARSGTSINSSYGFGTTNGTSTRIMYGDSSAWGDWTYTVDSTINSGYPIQKSLVWFCNEVPSQSIYGKLKNYFRFSEST